MLLWVIGVKGKSGLIKMSRNPKPRYKGAVIAGNHRQFTFYFRGADRYDYLYVARGIELLGLHNIPLFFVGEYWKSPVFIYQQDLLNEKKWEFQHWASKNFSGC